MTRSREKPSPALTDGHQSGPSREPSTHTNEDRRNGMARKPCELCAAPRTGRIALFRSTKTDDGRRNVPVCQACYDHNRIPQKGRAPKYLEEYIDT